MERRQRKAIWGWYLYDWAAQPYNTLLITFIFAPYFASAVADNPVDGQVMWGSMLTIVGFTMAVVAPILGAVADSSGPRKPWIGLFSVMYVLGSAQLWYAVPAGDNVGMILAAFAIGFIGMELSQIFVNAIMPTLAPREDLGVLSGTGWALGYVGGVLALVIMLCFFADDGGKTLIGLDPLFGLDAETREGTRFVGPLVAVWYVVFIVPFFLWVPDVERRTASFAAMRKGLSELGHTIATLPQQSSLFAYLGSSMFYRDALNGLYGFGGIYASGVLGWTVTQIGVFGILAAITGAIFAYLGGFADRRFGPKTVIVTSICALIVVCLLIVGTSRTSFFGMELAAGSSFPDVLFYICGAVIGAGGGTLQAASRTYLVDQANPDRMTEAFGIYALAGRATAFLAPALITAATAITGSQQLGVSPIILLFVIGLVLLIWVRSSEEYQ